MTPSNTMHIGTAPTTAAGTISGTPSQEAWFAGGERVGYDPTARAIVPAQGAPLNVFLRRGRGSHARRLLPAGISRRLIRVGESSAAFAER